MRQPPKKGLLSYFLPFLLLGVIISSGIYFINRSGSFMFSAGVPVVLQIIEPDVKVLLKNKETWSDVPKVASGVKLFSGDTVKTLVKGEAKLHLLNESFVYLGNNTTILLEGVEESGSREKTSAHYLNGKVLVSVSRILNPKSEFIIHYGNIDFDSRGGVFVLEDGLLQVLEGKVVVKRFEEEKEVANTQVGVGQQLVFDVNAYGDFGDITAVDPELYVSPWTEKAFGNGKELEVPDVIISEKTEMVSEEITEEGEEITENLEDSSSEDVLQSHELTLISPEENSQGVREITTEPLELKGKVSKGAVSVTVNDYVLGKFKEGDTEWLYRAKQEWDNLSKGVNTYAIHVKFSDGKEVKETVQILFSPEESEETSEESSTSTEESEESEETQSESPETVSEETLESSSDTLQLAVLAPKEGEFIDTDPVTIRGTAPEGTAKITVGDYTLQTFSLGDTQWKYVASKQYGNLEPGENTHLITAYDKDGNELAVLRFSFTSTAE